MKQGFKISFGVVFGIVAALVVICCGVPLSLGVIGAWSRKPAEKPVAKRAELPKPMRETTLADIQSAMTSNEVYAMDTLRSNRWAVTFSVLVIIDNGPAASLGADSEEKPFLKARFIFPQSARSEIAKLSIGQTVTAECDFYDRDRDLLTFDNCRLKN